MKQIQSFEEMVDGETYRYGKEDVDRKQTFRFEKNEGWEFVTLHYKDGYVADPSKENFKRHIQEGKVYKK